MKLFDKEQIVEAFSTFWANIATLFGRNNGLATLNSKGKIPLSQIDDSLFNDHIEYVDEVPTEDIKNKIYAVPHSYTTDDNKETNTLDIIGSYTTIQSNGKYVVDDNVVLSLDGVTIGSMFVSGTTVNLYTGKDFTGLLARTVTTSAINVWNVKQTVNHRDYYCGNEDAQTVTKMANVDQVEDWFIRKEQKGAPGGVAILNADGKIPVDELSFNTLVFMGLSSNLATDIAEIGELASGMFFIANAEQVYDEVTYYPGDWCIWDGTSWSRQANVNVVSSVNDKVGNVMLTGDDIPVTYEGEEDTLNNTLPKLGKVKTVNGNGPDSNGNITIEFTSDDIANESDYPGDTVTEVLNSYEALINSKANGDNVVTLDGNQTISGWKEFEKSIYLQGHLEVGLIEPYLGPDDEDGSVWISGYTKGGTNASVKVGYDVEMSGDAIKANNKNIVTSVNDETANYDGELYLNNLGKVEESITKSWTPAVFSANNGFQIGGGSAKTRGMSPSNIYVDTGSSGKWLERSDPSWAVQINAGTSFYVPVVTEGTITVTYYNQGTKTYNVNTGNMVTVSGQNGKFYKIDCTENDYIGTITYSHTTDFALKTVGKDVELLGGLTLGGNITNDEIYIANGKAVLGYGQPDSSFTSDESVNWWPDDGVYIAERGEETAGIGLTGNGVVMWATNDDDFFRFYDEDSIDGDPVFRIDGDGVFYRGQRLLTEGESSSIDYNSEEFKNAVRAAVGFYIEG